MDFLNMMFYTGVTLGILIFVHEFGHFIAAKLTGMRVDRFSIGFPPRAFGKKVGDTDYCISWLPLGGYVKIAGMVDESMDTDFVDRKPEPWEFRARPMWARITVISAGVIMNVLLAVAIFSSLHYLRGKDSIPTTGVGYVREGSPSWQGGLRAGDRIMSVNGDAVETWEDLQQQSYIEKMGEDLTFVVERGGGSVTVEIPAVRTDGFPVENLGFYLGATVTSVGYVEPGMPAAAAGLQEGDTLLTIAGAGIVDAQQIIDILTARPGEQVGIEWKRGDRRMSGTATVSDEGKIGIGISGDYRGPRRHTDYTLTEAIGRGFTEAGNTVRLFSLTIGKIVSGETSVKQTFGGPIAIARMATQSAEYGLLPFLFFMAQLSMSLAILNILPIPALDGGHLVLLIIEKIIRREIPHRIKIAVQQVGFILLLGFMAFIIYNDISRF